MWKKRPPYPPKSPQQMHEIVRATRNSEGLAQELEFRPSRFSACFQVVQVFRSPLGHLMLAAGAQVSIPEGSEQHLVIYPQGAVRGRGPAVSAQQPRPGLACGRADQSVVDCATGQLEIARLAKELPVTIYVEC